MSASKPNGSAAGDAGAGRDGDGDGETARRGVAEEAGWRAAATRLGRGLAFAAPGVPWSLRRGEDAEEMEGSMAASTGEWRSGDRKPGRRNSRGSGEGRRGRASD